MESEILTAAVALVGVALGSYLESLRARRLFAAQRRAEFFDREESILRELFEIIAEHRRVYSRHITSAISAAALGHGRDPVAQVIPWERLSMLCGMYAPELAELHARLSTLSTGIGTRLADAMLGERHTGLSRAQLGQALADDLVTVGGIYSEMERLLLARASELRTLIRAGAGVPANPDLPAKA